MIIILKYSKRKWDTWIFFLSGNATPNNMHSDRLFIKYRLPESKNQSYLTYYVFISVPIYSISMRGSRRAKEGVKESGRGSGGEWEG